jgi:cytoskeletal protein CcmA (bactofilin family)
MSNELRAFLDRGASFEGKVSFSGLLRIDGHLKGTAQSDGTLVVGETGLVQADVEVGTLLVRGSVTGAVRAQHRVEITPTGRLEGELVTPLLTVEEGGELRARVSMPGPAGKPDTAPPKREER